MENKYVQILLATYNGELYLEEQLDSIIKQTFTNWHVLIRDDMSSDNTPLIIEKYALKYPAKFKVLKDSFGNLGSSLNFEKLLEASDKNSYIMFCDQDDVWLPMKIELTLNKLLEIENKSNKTIPALIFSDLFVVDKELNLINDSFWKYSKLNPRISSNINSIIANSVVTGCTMIFNKELNSIIKEIPKVIIHDQWVSILACKFGVISYVNRPLVLYRQHDKNVVGSALVNIKYLLRKILSPIKTFQTINEVCDQLPFHCNKALVYKEKVLFNIKRLF